MIRFLFDWIISSLFFRDITITLNGSKITFSKEGDIILQPQRSLISFSKYNFFSCTSTDITKIMNKLDNSEDIDLQETEDVCCN